ncbi:39S ribosomal protein L45, mitochondrial [Strongyloides ratti]|uniref:Large ribosomal subunit protein mL45 n=1 Tax=Strongyloides ratti TaxID=34506 RepID=A0A090LFS3_STRRB|nr:39S ribosomal protein L45, mitochondrial [Strongyloides ratti]CEF66340.1 39S ribosomal protein L45, mitochondrial [Strongyloides ratti]
MNRLSASFPRLTIRLKDLTITQVAGVHHHKERGDLELFLGIKRSNRAKANRNTHKNERMFRRLRGQKTMLLELPDDVKIREREEMTPDELRRDMLKNGVNPYKDVSPRNWEEHQITLQSIYGVLDPYVPPKNPISFISFSSPLKNLEEKGKEIFGRTKGRFHNYMNGTRLIKKKEGYEKFNAREWASKNALNIYKNAYESMMSRNEKEICEYVTEHAFSKLWPDVENGSIFFELVEETKPPKVVSVRCSDNPQNSGNMIAQVIVQLCTKQKIAVFDRFGHLILGSKDKIKDVEEYIVYENHIADTDGKWRLHDKVYPSFADNVKEIPLITKLEKPSKSKEKSLENVESKKSIDKTEEEKKEEK